MIQKIQNFCYFMLGMNTLMRAVCKMDGMDVSWWLVFRPMLIGCGLMVIDYLLQVYLVKRDHDTTHRE